jgi:hypothetical protein
MAPHLKASQGASNEAIRLSGAQTIRNDADALPQGTHIIYCGDFNLYSNAEPAYLEFLSAGNGQAFDPLGSGSWAGALNAIKHSQSPRDITADGLVGGGMDDRFDFQLSSSEFQDDTASRSSVARIEAWATTAITTTSRSTPATTPITRTTSRARTRWLTSCSTRPITFR